MADGLMGEKMAEPGCGNLLGRLACLPLLLLWRAYVLTLLWAWHVVPTLGLPALRIAPAAGLWLVVHLLKDMHLRTKRERELFYDSTYDGWLDTVVGFLQPLMLLGAGYVVWRLT